MYDQAAVDVQIQTLRTVSPPSPCPFITGQIKVELTNLTLLPPSPYRLIIEQIEVDLINLEDEVETFNSLLPIAHWASTCSYYKSEKSMNFVVLYLKFAGKCRVTKM